MWPAISNSADHPNRASLERSPAGHAADTTPAADVATLGERARLNGRPALLRFCRHYAEMVAAMLSGMVVLGLLESLLASAIGQPHALHGTTSGALLMTANMTVAMTGWMRFRGHRPRLIAEMAAGMNIPFLALVVPFRTGLSGEHALMMSGHALMFLGMALVMLARRHEYSSARLHR